MLKPDQTNSSSDGRPSTETAGLPRRVVTRTNISKAWSLSQIEKELANVFSRCTGDEHVIWLPRRGLQTVIFRPAWLFAYLSTLRAREQLTIIDWFQSSTQGNPSSTETNFRDRFLRKIEGLAAIHSAHRLKDARGASLAIDPHHVQTHLDAGSTLEEGTNLQTRASIVSWDPQKSIPTAFIRVSTGNEAVEYKEWSEAFIHAVNGARVLPLLPYYLRSRSSLPAEVPRQEVFSRAFSAESALRRLIYELYKNALVHGRKQHIEGGQDKIIPGPRYISVAKFIYANQRDLEKRIHGFPELQTYFSRYSTTSRFVEITIGDVGMGVINRFASKASAALRPPSSKDALPFLNRIIRENLSSNRSDPSAGLGFERALRAIRTLNGFLTIRTNCVWAHYSHQHSPNAMELQPVTTLFELADIVGTHFGILLPLEGR